MQGDFTTTICPRCKKPGIFFFQARRELLSNPRLFDLLDEELARMIVGENRTRRAILLFSLIRLVKNKGAGSCSNLLINSGPSAGKDYLSRTICDLHPKEAVRAFSRVSPTALGRWMAGEAGFTWEGKIARLTDISSDIVRSDAFKVFLSETEAALLTGKNKSGQTVTEEVEVQGRPVLIATTANASASEELLNRFSVVELDESKEQNAAVVRWKLRKAEGTGKGEKASPLIREAISKLISVEVVIPFASRLEGHVPTENQRIRRDIDRLLNMVRASAALYQYQRERDEDGRVIANGQDYAIAAEALTVIKSGTAANLTRAQRRIWDACRTFSKTHESFTRQELYAAHPLCGLSQLFGHLSKLAEVGLLKVDYRDGATKPILTYAVVDAPLNNLQLPSFQELDKPELSKLTKQSELSKISKLSSFKKGENAENSDNPAFENVGNAETEAGQVKTNSSLGGLPCLGGNISNDSSPSLQKTQGLGQELNL